MRPETYPFVMRQLPYEYDSLAPTLKEPTLRIHHDRHYKMYVDDLNSALSDYTDLQDITLEEILNNISCMPNAIKQKVKNAAGGVYNHELFFDSLKSVDWQEPAGIFKEAVEYTFGTLKNMQDILKEEALSVFGSGWVYLVSDRQGILYVVKTIGQDVPDLRIYTPLLAIDMWEHAYYLQFQNRRGDYVDAVLKLLHWIKIGRRYEEVERDEQEEFPEGIGNDFG